MGSKRQRWQWKIFNMNGVTGTLGYGLISPFQGFWVKANASSPSLIVKKAAKTTGGNFVRKESSFTIPILELEAATDGMSKRINFIFSEDGAKGLDQYDGYRIVPFSDSHIEFYSLLNDGTQLAINSLPRILTNSIKIPLSLRAFEDGIPYSGTFAISLSGIKGVPEEWLINLIGNDTGEIIDLKADGGHSFYYESKGKISSNSEKGKMK